MTSTTVLRRGLVGLALGACFGLAACGDDDTASGAAADSNGGSESVEGKKVIYSNYGSQIPFFQTVGKGATAKADELGLDFTLSTSEIDPAKQIDDFENALTQQPDGLIVSPLDAAAIVPSVRQAIESDIPVVLLADTLAEDAGQLSYVGADFEAIGRMKAEYLAGKLEDGDTVAMVNGSRGLGFVEEQATAAREIFEEAGLELVDDVYTRAITPDEGLRATENILTRHPDVKAIFYSGDDGALGGVKAMERADLEPGSILLVGTDGNDSAIEAIREGKMAMTVAQCAFQQGEIAVQVLTDYLKTGERPSPRTETPVIEVSTDNIEEATSSQEWEDCGGR